MSMRGRGAIVVRLDKQNFREQSDIDSAKKEAVRLSLKEGVPVCVYAPVFLYNPPTINGDRILKTLTPHIVNLSQPKNKTTEPWMTEGGTGSGNGGSTREAYQFEEAGA